MRMGLLCLLLGLSVPLSAQDIVLLAGSGSSISNADVHIDAGEGGQGSAQRNTGAAGSAAAAGVIDSTDYATGVCSITTDGFVLPNQLTAGAGHSGGLMSHNGSVEIVNFDVPFVGDFELSGDDVDGDGIDDSIDFEVNGTTTGTDDDGNGIQDSFDDVAAALNDGQAGFDDAGSSTTTRASYIFNVPPAAPGSGMVWVASGSYYVEASGLDACEANAGNPAVGATIDTDMGIANAVVTDVLAGTRTFIDQEVATTLQGTWSIVVGVGPDNPFPMQVNVSTRIHNSLVWGGTTKSLIGNASANVSISNVTLVSADSLSPLVDVEVISPGGNGDDGDSSNDEDYEDDYYEDDYYEEDYEDEYYEEDYDEYYCG